MMNRTLKESFPVTSNYLKRPQYHPIHEESCYHRKKITLNPTARYIGQVFDTEEGKKNPPNLGELCLRSEDKIY